MDMDPDDYEAERQHILRVLTDGDDDMTPEIEKTAGQLVRLRNS